jgi:putative sigma-54 modulation protein
MNMKVSFKHLESTEAIKAHVYDKTEKLKKYFDGKIDVTWNFSVEKLDHIAHCHILGNHMDYFGEAKSTDLYASIELAIDKIESQLRKHKEKVTNHHHKN